MYEATTQQLIDPVLNGYNATVFAYGATGSGKTHTMIGSQSAGPGVMVLSMRDLFEAVHGTKQDANGNLVEFKIEMSYLEIYNETIRDLLIDSDRPLDIRENRFFFLYFFLVSMVVFSFSLKQFMNSHNLTVKGIV